MNIKLNGLNYWCINILKLNNFWEYIFISIDLYQNGCSMGYIGPIKFLKGKKSRK